MRFVLKAIILMLVIGCEVACIANINLREGINSFRIQNYREAFIRLLPEAKKGNPDAQYAVGYMYFYAQGVVENRKKAKYWITAAAKAGQPEAVEAMVILAKAETEPKNILGGGI